MARADAILAAVQRIHKAPLAPDCWMRAPSSMTIVADARAYWPIKRQEWLVLLDSSGGQGAAAHT
jgi:hypothetical protein